MVDFLYPRTGMSRPRWTEEAAETGTPAITGTSSEPSSTRITPLEAAGIGRAIVLRCGRCSSHWGVLIVAAHRAARLGH
jgi:hypothetical protein